MRARRRHRDHRRDSAEQRVSGSGGTKEADVGGEETGDDVIARHRHDLGFGRHGFGGILDRLDEPVGDDQSHALGDGALGYIDNIHAQVGGGDGRRLAM